MIPGTQPTQTPRRTGDSHELRPLTGIRAVAAAGVLLFHARHPWLILLPRLKIISCLASNGALGVDLFFMLSGFILSYVYCAGDSELSLPEYRRFVWFRLARVYPNHLCMLLAYVLLILLAWISRVKINPLDYPWSGLPYQLTMTHVWPGLWGGQWNVPSWTISAEWFAYLFVFPISWRLLRAHWSGIGFLLAACALLTLLWAALWAASLVPSSTWEPGHRPMALPTVSLEFLAGSMLFGVCRARHAFARFCQRQATAVFLLVLLSMAIFPPSTTLVFVMTCLFGTMLLALESDASSIARLLSTKPVLWLGRLSYALYMSHYLALELLKRFLPAERFEHSSLGLRLGVFLANIVAIAAAASGLHYIVELPGRNFMRSIARSRMRARPVASSAAG